jgi:protein-L-isoaspartate(D-aspartate) O-methyltransferase
MRNASLYLFLFTLFSSFFDYATAQTDAQTYTQNRIRMVAQQIKARGITDSNVLAVMESVPRHDFVPQKLRSRAYIDRPLPIGEGQTISQPYIVALMSDSLALTGNESVLEIGTGSGYQAAVLSGLAAKVITMEIKPKLFETASQRLKVLAFDNVSCYLGDGYFGYPQQAPYDAIMITAAVDHIPPPLLKQLKTGGRLILPLGNPFSYQHLVLVTKQAQRYSVQQITGVLFVPMTGHALQQAGKRTAPE